MWATCNIGANNIKEPGDYYAWGQIEKLTYSDYCAICKWSELSYFSEIVDDAPKFSKYNDEGLGLYNELDIEDDVVNILCVWWGGAEWRIPSKWEFKELAYECEWSLEISGNTAGYRVEGPNGNSIFLPYTDWRLSQHKPDFDLNMGYYWTRHNPRKHQSKAIAYRFYQSAYYVSSRHINEDRNVGLCIRPVFCDSVE